MCIYDVFCLGMRKVLCLVKVFLNKMMFISEIDPRRKKQKAVPIDKKIKGELRVSPYSIYCLITDESHHIYTGYLPRFNRFQSKSKKEIIIFFTRSPFCVKLLLNKKEKREKVRGQNLTCRINSTMFLFLRPLLVSRDPCFFPNFWLFLIQTSPLISFL